MPPAGCSTVPDTMLILEAIDRSLDAVLLRRKQRTLAPLERSTATNLRTAFRRQKAIVVAALADAHDHQQYHEAAEPAPDPDEARWLRTAFVLVLMDALSEAETATMADMTSILTNASQRALLAGGNAAMRDLGITGSFDLQNPRAVAYMQAHGAAMVTQINQTTRTQLNHLLTKSIANGDSYGEIAKQIRTKFDQFARPQPQRHIRDRAELVAIQETHDAFEASNEMVAQDLQASGLPVEKHALTANDERVDGECHGNSDAGWIALADAYPDGNMRPPFHVACRCSQQTRTKEAR